MQSVLFVSWVNLKVPKVDPASFKVDVISSDSADLTFPMIHQIIGSRTLFDGKKVCRFGVLADSSEWSCREVTDRAVFCGTDDKVYFMRDGKTIQKSSFQVMKSRLADYSKTEADHRVTRYCLSIHQAVLYCLTKRGEAYSMVVDDAMRCKWSRSPIVKGIYHHIEARHSKLLLIRYPNLVCLCDVDCCGLMQGHRSVQVNYFEYLDESGITCAVLTKHHVFVSVYDYEAEFNDLHRFDSTLAGGRMLRLAGRGKAIHLSSYRLNPKQTILIHTFTKIMWVLLSTQDGVQQLEGLPVLLNSTSIDMTMLIDRNIVVCNKTSIRCVYRIIL